MKKLSPFIIAVLIVLQIFTLIRIDSLQQNLQNLQSQLVGLRSTLSLQIEQLKTSQAAQAKAQASILERFEYSLGALDPANLTVAMTFTITPKTARSDTKAALFIGSERADMVRQGAVFAVTRPVGIFADLAATAVLTDGDQQRTEQLDLPLSLRQAVLPTVFARLDPTGSSGSNGGASGNGSVSADGSSFRKTAGTAAGEFAVKGRLLVDVKPVKGNAIEKARLLVDVDGRIVAEKPINTSGQGNEIDERQTLLAGQTVTLLVEATDQLGLRYRIVISRLSLDATVTPVARAECLASGEAAILDREGKTVFQPLA